MNRRRIAAGLVTTLSGLWIAAHHPAWGQQMAPPSGQKTLAATVGAYVFPAQGQSSEQQSKEEAECYGWAVQNTGTDPFELAQQTERQQQQATRTIEQARSGRPAGAAGALGGAAAGAAIGELASDDAGKGAAYGGAAGLLRARRKARTDMARAAGTASQQAQQAAQQQMEAFKKAFSVCLEAKHYMVKW